MRPPSLPGIVDGKMTIVKVYSKGLHYREGEAMTRFVSVGICVLDHVWRMAALPTGAGKFSAEDHAESGGGIAATASVAIARLGAGSALWSRVGADAAGDAILDGLRRENVDVSGVERVAGAASVTAGVIVDRAGERMIAIHRDPRLWIAPPSLPLDDLGRADGLLADTRWIDGAERALAEARRRNLPAVLDVEPSPPDAYTRLCPLASHVVFSRDGLADFSGTGDPRDGLDLAHRRLGIVVGVTLGSDGVALRTADGFAQVPAPRVAVVDTTGAGDAFHGAFLVALIERGDPIEAARFANAVAALKCMRLGGRSGLPRRADVVRFIEEQVK
jgi:sulfofructose kinase